MGPLIDSAISTQQELENTCELYERDLAELEQLEAEHAALAAAFQQQVDVVGTDASLSTVRSACDALETANYKMEESLRKSTATQESLGSPPISVIAFLFKNDLSIKDHQ